jgi:hypothetical protein
LNHAESAATEAAIMPRVAQEYQDPPLARIIHGKRRSRHNASGAKANQLCLEAAN